VQPGSASWRAALEIEHEPPPYGSEAAQLRPRGARPAAGAAPDRRV